MLATTSLLLALAACSSEAASAPNRLLDGSPVEEPPVELEGVDEPSVLTRAALATRSDDPIVRSCLDARWDGRSTSVPAVVRVGVVSETVTLPDETGAAVIGCDGTRGGEGERWCGGSYGQLTSGSLRDPRLDVLCTTAQGAPVAHAWIEPAAGARYVAIRQPGYVEVYPVLGDLPVRVSSTSGVDLERSAAEFDVSEHDARGRLVREYRLSAQVAG